MTNVKGTFDFKYNGEQYEATVIGHGEPEEQIEEMKVFVTGGSDSENAKNYITAKIYIGISGETHFRVPMTFERNSIGNLYSVLDGYGAKIELDGSLYTEEEMKEAEELEKEGVVF